MTTTTTEIVMDDVQPPTILNTFTDDRLTFPQDFKIPEGVTIIPFKDFKERGIRVDPGPNDEEVDGLGIPTIAMSPHATDRCKTNTISIKKKQEMVKRKALASKTPLSWWEHWEFDEETRRAKPMNATASRVQKFLAAASDFKNGRLWPSGISQQTDPAYIWTKLENFLGIVPTKKVKKSKKIFHESVMESDDDLDDEGVQASDDEFVVSKDKKALDFIKDPETSMKIFLSSYARKKGIIWSQINLEQMPRLVKFFLEFLIRNRVFPESETGLRLAIEVANKSLVELPLIFNISSNLSSEAFGKACRLLWGVKAEGYHSVELDDDFLKSLDEPRIAEVKDNDESEIKSEVELLDSTADDQGWGANEWGTAMDSTAAGGWGESVDVAAFEPPPVDSWVIEEDAMPKIQLPSAIATTHTTGIVERSFRKIKNLIPVPTNLPVPATSVSGAPPGAADVESELERTYPKVVLTPWLNWDDGEMPVYSNPTILETSKGPVVDPPYKTIEGDAPKPAAGAPKKHDPGNDDITVLVEPSIFEMLQTAKGMSIAGTWVQIVRQPKALSDEPAPEKKKKSKKKAANLWYLDEMAAVFPTFWAIPDA